MGPITLRTTVAFYRAGDTITVNVNNRSGQTIYFFPDHLTNCTVFSCSARRCSHRPVRPGRMGSIPARWLSPRACILWGQENALPSNCWPLKTGGWWGLYHVTLTYRISPTAGSPVTITSNVFTIGPLVSQP